MTSLAMTLTPGGPPKSNSVLLSYLGLPSLIVAVGDKPPRHLSAGIRGRGSFERVKVEKLYTDGIH